jgi:hypothetical protein
MPSSGPPLSDRDIKAFFRDPAVKRFFRDLWKDPPPKRQHRKPLAVVEACSGKKRIGRGPWAHCKTAADKAHLKTLNGANRDRMPGLALKGGLAMKKKFEALEPAQQRAIVERLTLARRAAAANRRIRFVDKKTGRPSPMKLTLPAWMFDAFDRCWVRPPRRRGQPRRSRPEEPPSG